MPNRDHDNYGETLDLAGSCEVSPLAHRAGLTATVIPFPKSPSRSAATLAAWGEEQADDYFESIGLLAVRLVGNFTRPRIHVMGATEDSLEDNSPPWL